MVTPISGRVGPVEAGSDTPSPRALSARAAPRLELPQTPAAAAPASDPVQLQEAVQRAESAVRQFASNLSFSLDRDTGKTVIKILDSQTNEVIRQIPSEELLAISRNLDRIEGLLLKQRV